VNCPGCGCELSDYEVFAARIRRNKKPVCVGCLNVLLYWTREVFWPLLHQPLPVNLEVVQSILQENLRATCQICGAEIDARASACPYCGALRPEPKDALQG